MRRRKLIVRLLLLLTAAQVLIFIFRDRFQYRPYASVAELYAPCPAACTATWRLFADDYRNELPAAKILSDSVTASLQLSATRVLALGRFLYAKFHNRLGEPPPALLSASPMQQYAMLNANDTMQLWCGNFAQMFALLCWAEGIACRNLEIMNPGDHHVLNECYFPETGRWAAVDLTHNLLLAADSTDSFLDARQLTEAIESGKDIKAWRSAGDTIEIRRWDSGREDLLPYYRKINEVHYYHRTDNERAYGLSNRLRQYFLPVSWYDILTGNGGSNALFYLKDVLALSWLLALAAFLATKFYL